MKTRLATAALFGALCVLPATGFAHGKMGKKNVKVISDSAAALATSNPDLSSRLKELASREGAAKEKSDAATDEDEDVQTLKDAAQALKTKRPDLAKGLERCAKMEAKERSPKKGAGKEGRMPETKGQTPPKESPSGY